MIGDSETQDIDPAAKLGWRTFHVWSELPSLEKLELRDRGRDS